jgi:glycerophosphoryl diester phosphodiesterase
MKNIFPVLALAFVALGGCAMNGPAAPADTTRMADLQSNLVDADGSVMVVAHRACFADGAPENSLAGIEHCFDLGADMIEIDVALSAEGVPVLMHDVTLDRMTEVSGPVSSYTVAELAGLRLRAREGGPEEPFTEQTVPTLREALELANGRILINLDVKGDAYAPAFEIVRQLGMQDQIVMKMAAGPEDEALIGAPFLGETYFMPIFRQCTDNTRRGSCAPTLSQVVDGYDQFDPVAYEITFVDLGYLTEGVPVMLENDRRIWVNTLQPHHAAGLVDDDAVLDPDAVWGVLIAQGADMIQTDTPRELIAYLRERGLRD